MRLCDLSPSHISQLTRILQLRLAEDAITYSSTTLKLIDNLPSELKRPNRLSRLVLPAQKAFTPLCALHKRLHAPLVHAIFTLVALEVGVRLNSLVSHGQWLSEEQTARVQRLRELHALWLSAEVYVKTFLVSASEVRKWRYQSDQCEACMLARMMGDLEVLVDLRVVLLSRTTKRFVARHGRPRLTEWLEAWIANLTTSMKESKVGDEEFVGMISRSEREGQKLKDVRKKVAKEKKAKNRKANEVGSVWPSSTTTSPTLEASVDADFKPLPITRSISRMTLDVRDDGHTHDAELDIIDHYAALLSTPHLPNPRSSTLGANRTDSTNEMPGWPPISIASRLSNVTDDVDSRGRHPYMHPTQRAAFEESVYSIDTIRNNDRVIRGPAGLKPVTVQEEEVDDDEYVPPAKQGKEDVRGGTKTPKVRIPAENRAQIYQDLLQPRAEPGESVQSHRSWATASIAPTTPSGTQLALHLANAMGLDVAVAPEDSAVWLNDMERTPRRKQSQALQSSAEGNVLGNLAKSRKSSSTIRPKRAARAAAFYALTGERQSTDSANRKSRAP